MPFPKISASPLRAAPSVHGRRSCCCRSPATPTRSDADSSRCDIDAVILDRSGKLPATSRSTSSTIASAPAPHLGQSAARGALAAGQAGTRRDVYFIRDRRRAPDGSRRASSSPDRPARLPPPASSGLRRGHSAAPRRWSAPAGGDYLTAVPRPPGARHIAVEIVLGRLFLDDPARGAVAHAIFADGGPALARTTDGRGRRSWHRTLFHSEASGAIDSSIRADGCG